MHELTFVSITSQDIPLLEKWFQKEHVKPYWNTSNTWKEDYLVKRKDLERFIVYSKNTPFAFIQFYQMIGETIGIDQLIGEEDFLHKGNGQLLISSFISFLREKFVFDKVLVDPYCNNLKAIKCYEKLGFKIKGKKKKMLIMVLEIKEKVEIINSSLKCHYYKITKSNQTFFRKELHLKEEPWTTLFFNEILFYENIQNFQYLKEYLPVVSSTDKDHYKITLNLIEHKNIVSNRYLEKLPMQILASFFDFSNLCTYFTLANQDESYLESRIIKLKQSNLLSNNIIRFIEKNTSSIKELFLSHGDTIPKNLLLTKEDKLKVIDWEFWGYKPKFFDLSLLYICTKDKKQKEKILDFVIQNNGINSFLISLGINLEKELRIHLKDKDLHSELDYLKKEIQYYEQNLLNQAIEN